MVTFDLRTSLSLGTGRPLDGVTVGCEVWLGSVEHILGEEDEVTAGCEVRLGTVEHFMGEDGEDRSYVQSDDY